MLNVQLIDAETVGYSTFQSNNQRCVSNQYGIFIAYVKSTTALIYTNQSWVLRQSIDNGRTFTTIYSANCLDQNPIIETDSLGNLYIMIVDSYTTSKFYKFLYTDYTVPTFTKTVPINYPSKHCMYLDDVNNKIYYIIAEKGFLTILNKSGTIIQVKKDLLVTGANGFMEYPSITLDNNGVLYFAWTVQKVLGGKPSASYYSIAWCKSTDYGASFTTADGTALTLPFSCDLNGPSNQIADVVSLNVSDIWLSSWTFVNGRLHAMFYMGDTIMHYCRINPYTGVKEIDANLITVASNINIDGLLSRDNTGSFLTPTALYFIGSMNNRRNPIAYKSIDNGVTWVVYANHKDELYDFTYSICGYREQVNNACIGVFTLINGRGINDYTINKGAYTYFFKLDI